MCDYNRKKAIDAVDLLNDFVGDFITGTMSLAQYHAEYNSGIITYEQLTGINKMCLSHLILSLTKWAEFYKKFHSFIPSELKEESKNFIKIIENRKMIDFRNKCIGHIWDKDVDRPLINSEIMTWLDKITNSDIQVFLKWLNNANSTNSSISVAGISEMIRDKITIKYDISPNEIMR